MPGPVVYVAVGIVTFVAIVAFKEFVLDPWREERKARRQQQQQQQQQRRAMPVLASRGSGSEDRGPSMRQRGPRRSPSPKSEHSSVELEDLVRREVQAWTTAAAAGSAGRDAQAGLRQRGAKSGAVNPFQSESREELLFDYPASPTLSPARTPAASSSTSSLTLSSPPASGPAASDFTLSPDLSRSPLPPASSPAPPRSPFALSASSRSSTPDTDVLLSSSVLSTASQNDAAYFTPGSDPSSASLSPRDMTPRSPLAPLPVDHEHEHSPRVGAISPFSELLSPASEPIDLAPSSEDEEMFSVRSDDETFASARDGASTVHNEDERFSVPSSSSDESDFEDLHQEIRSWGQGADRR